MVGLFVLVALHDMQERKLLTSLRHLSWPWCSCISYLVLQLLLFQMEKIEDGLIR